MSIISRGKCHRQLFENKKKRKMGKKFAARMLRGGLILSDACFQHRVSDSPPLTLSFSLRRALFLSARGTFLVKISEFLWRGFCNRERRERPLPPSSLSSSLSLSSCFQCEQYTGFKMRPIYATTKEKRIRYGETREKSRV